MFANAQVGMMTKLDEVWVMLKENSISSVKPLKP